MTNIRELKAKVNVSKNLAKKMVKAKRTKPATPLSLSEVQSWKLLEMAQALGYKVPPYDTEKARILWIEAYRGGKSWTRGGWLRVPNCDYPPIIDPSMEELMPLKGKDRRSSFDIDECPEDRVSKASIEDVVKSEEYQRAVGDVPEPDLAVNIYTVMMTPQLAAWILANKRGRNRCLKASKDLFGDALKNGRFVFNGDAIRFDSRGYLIDGHNRLTACVESGIPFEAIIIEGLSEEAAKTIDRGKVRDIADAVRRIGIENGNKKAAVVKVYLAVHDAVRDARADHKGEFTVHVPIASKVDRDIAEAYLTTYVTEVETAFRMGLDAYNKKRGIGLAPAVAGGGYMLLKEENGSAKAVDLFFEGLATAYSTQLTAGSPLFLLRERVRTAIGTRGVRSMAEDEQLALLFTAWNAFLEGRDDLNILRTPGRAVPSKAHLIPIPDKA